MPVNSFDVIVIGGGLAGVCAAEAALSSGAETALITRGWLGGIGVRGSGASGCGTSEGGVPAFFRLQEESFDGEEYRERMIGAGLGVLEREMASFFVEELLKLKPQAEEIMGLYRQPGPFTLGTPLVYARLEALRKGAKVFPHTSALRLLTRDNRCHGTLCVDENTGETFPLYGKSIILAAGGDAGLFAVNVHPECVSGDGYALGLQAGAEVVNLEFMQIFAMTTAPTRNLIHFWKEEYLSRLYNREGEEFLGAYLPAGISAGQCISENILHAPFSVRDRASRYLAIGIVSEIRAGRGTKSGGIYVDLRDCPSFWNSRQDHFFRYRGIEAASHPVEVSMGFQCCNGGLRVNRRMETSVEGLLAAGENAGGLHGADRLGGNMLAGCLITGSIAGRRAAELAKKRAHAEKIPFEPAASLVAAPRLAAACAPFIQEIRRAAWEDLLVIKSRDSLRSFRKRLAAAAEQVRRTVGSAAAVPVEVENLVLLGKALAAATVEREESRGGFYREDFPGPGQGAPQVHLLSLSGEGEIKLRKVVFDPQWSPDTHDRLDKTHWG